MLDRGGRLYQVLWNLNLVTGSMPERNKGPEFHRGVGHNIGYAEGTLEERRAVLIYGRAYASVQGGPKDSFRVFLETFLDTIEDEQHRV